MPVDKFSLLQYQAWESNALKEYSDLLEKYNSFKTKEENVLGQKDVKNSKRDMLLKFKADNTLSKIGNLELEHIDREEAIEANFRRNIKVIEDSKLSKITSAEKEYEKIIAIALEKRDKKIEEAVLACENANNYYNSERDSSLSKCKRDYDSKKRILEARGEQVEQMRTIDMKSTTEISMEKQKYDILSKMNDCILKMKISRSQVEGADTIANNIPTLPETFEKKAGVSAPVQSFETLGEDSSAAILREESRREDARLRREAHEMEMEREEKAFQYRRQLEIDAQERKRANEQYRKEETKKVKEDVSKSQQTHTLTQDDDKDSMTSQEIKEYIEERKRSMKGYKVSMVQDDENEHLFEKEREQMANQLHEEHRAEEEAERNFDERLAQEKSFSLKRQIKHASSVRKVSVPGFQGSYNLIKSTH